MKPGSRADGLFEPVDTALLASAAATVAILALHEQFAALLAAVTAYAGAWLVLRWQH